MSKAFQKLMLIVEKVLTVLVIAGALTAGLRAFKDHLAVNNPDREPVKEEESEAIVI